MENFFNNCSFLFLLGSMAFYWIRAFFNVPLFSFLGKLTVVGANIVMFFLLIYRGFYENHFPLSNPAIKKISLKCFYNINIINIKSDNKIEF